MPCFPDCQCQCGEYDSTFDRIRLEETRFSEELARLTSANIGWFTDRSICDHHLNSWDLSDKSGLYILWHKSDYCDVHDKFHMRALYVGKGTIGRRFFTHWRDKNFSEEMLVYWTFSPMTNRQSKYYEQLLLDLYNFPLNTSENSGAGALCAHLSQGQVD